VDFIGSYFIIHLTANSATLEFSVVQTVRRHELGFHCMSDLKYRRFKQGFGPWSTCC